MKGPRIVKKKSIDTEKDPYAPKLGPNDMAVCKKCGAVYHGKRWSLGGVAATGKSVAVMCPACQKIRDKFAEGFVTLQGDFLKDAGHREEILNLIHNKEKRAMHNNPLERIIEIKEKKGAIEVMTTTEKLAQRIGQMLHKAFDGKVEYKWSSDVKLARVVWTRQERAAE